MASARTAIITSSKAPSEALAQPTQLLQVCSHISICICISSAWYDMGICRPGITTRTVAHWNIFAFQLSDLAQPIQVSDQTPVRVAVSLDQVPAASGIQEVRRYSSVDPVTALAFSMKSCWRISISVAFLFCGHFDAIRIGTQTQCRNLNSHRTSLTRNMMVKTPDHFALRATSDVPRITWTVWRQLPGSL